MKDDFTINTLYLDTLEETLKEKKPLLVINVGTTGVDNSSFSNHTPMRVNVQELNYDEKTKNYEPIMTFDKIIACSAEALNHNRTMDIFAYNNIDKDKYAKGEDVTPVDKFQKEFCELLDEYKKADIKYITNDTEFCIKYLSKINCAEQLKNESNAGNVLDLQKMAKEYLSKGAYAPTKTVNLKNLIETAKTKVNLPLTEEEKILHGVDVRSKAIAEFIRLYGAEKGVLLSAEERHFEAVQNDIIEDMSQKGRKGYEETDLQGKIDALFRMNVVSEDIYDRNSRCELNKLLNVLEGKGKNIAKGFIVMQSATTGFGANNVPIQFSAIAYSLENGMPRLKENMSINIQADRKSLNMAKNNCTKAYKPFDAFAFCGIDINSYEEAILNNENPSSSNEKKSKKVYTQEEAVNCITQFFSNYDLNKDWALITSGNSENSNRSFTQESLTKLGNMELNDAPYIDFTQVLKEYVCKCHHEGKDISIFHNEWKERNFGLDSFAKNAGVTLSNTTARCNFVQFLIKDIAEQLNNEKAIEAVKEATEEENKKIEAIRNGDAPKEEENEEELFTSNTRLASSSIKKDAPMSFGRYVAANSDNSENELMERRMRPHIPNFIDEEENIENDIYKELGYERRSNRNSETNNERYNNRRPHFTRSEFERRYERDDGVVYPSSRERSTNSNVTNDSLNNFVNAMSDVLTKQANMVAEQTRFIAEQNNLLNTVIQQVTQQTAEATQQNERLLKMCEEQMNLILNMIAEREGVGKVSKLSEKIDINKTN